MPMSAHQNPPDRRRRGAPARITVALPMLWASYIENQCLDAFADEDPDDPWNREEADRTARQLETEGYELLGQAPNTETEYGTHAGTAGGLVDYLAINRDVLEQDAERGCWSISSDDPDTEYLLDYDISGIVWLPTSWMPRLTNPRHEIDDNDLDWNAATPRQPTDPDPDDFSDVDEHWLRLSWQDRGTPPGGDVDTWDEDAFDRALENVRSHGWDAEQALRITRMGWFLQHWGPLQAVAVVRATQPATPAATPSHPSIFIPTRPHGPSNGPDGNPRGSRR